MSEIRPESKDWDKLSIEEQMDIIAENCCVETETKCFGLIKKEKVVFEGEK